MNKQRRKEISDALERLSAIHEDVERARDDEQEYYDVMPEGIQESEKGEAADAVITALEEAMTAIEEAQSQLEEAAT